MRNLWRLSMFLALVEILPAPTKFIQAQETSQSCYNFADRAVKVRIESTGERDSTTYLYRPITEGTGWIVSRDSSFYYIVTAYHIIEPLVKNYDPTPRGIVPDTSIRVITIIFYGDRPARTAEIVGIDEALDVVLLKVRYHANIPPLDPFNVGNSDLVNPGENVYHIGNPYEMPFTFDKNSVAGIRRPVHAFPYIGDRIQLQNPVVGGTSGGPMLNQNCEVIGMIQFSLNDRNSPGAGYRFAIPVNDIAKILPRLQRGVNISHAYLYIRAVPVFQLSESAQKVLMKEFGIYEGIYVVHVPPGSSADQIGIHADDIIYKFDIHRVRDLSDITKRILFEYKPGDRVTIELYRLFQGGYVRVKLQAILVEARINYYEK